MESMLNSATDFLVRQSWQVSIVFVIVLALTWGLQKASAHWRYLLWLTVIAKCRTPPLFNVPLAILPADSTFSPLAPTVASERTTAHVVKTRSSVGTAQQPTLPPENQEQAVAAASSTPFRNPDRTSTFSLRQSIAIAWMALVGILLTYVAGKSWMIHQRLRRTRQIADAETASTVAMIAATLGISRPPLVYATSPGTQPFVWGWLRGDIYVPKDFGTTGSVGQRRATTGNDGQSLLTKWRMSQGGMRPRT